MGAVELVRQTVVSVYQLFDFTNEGPAQILELGDLAGLTQLAQDHFEKHPELLVLGNGLQHLLGESGLQFLNIPLLGIQVRAINGGDLVITARFLSLGAGLDRLLGGRRRGCKPFKDVDLQVGAIRVSLPGDQTGTR